MTRTKMRGKSGSSYSPQQTMSVLQKAKTQSATKPWKEPVSLEGSDDVKGAVFKKIPKQGGAVIRKKFSGIEKVKARDSLSAKNLKKHPIVVSKGSVTGKKFFWIEKVKPRDSISAKNLKKFPIAVSQESDDEDESDKENEDDESDTDEKSDGGGKPANGAAAALQKHKQLQQGSLDKKQIPEQGKANALTSVKQLKKPVAAEESDDDDEDGF